MNGHSSYLLGLIESFLASKVVVGEFCRRYEEYFNFDLDKSALKPGALDAFRSLFDTVVWYSPYEDERKKVPNYVGEDEVRAAAVQALQAVNALTLRKP